MEKAIFYQPTSLTKLHRRGPQTGREPDDFKGFVSITYAPSSWATEGRPGIHRREPRSTMDPGAAPLTRLVQDDGAGDGKRSEAPDIARFISGRILEQDRCEKPVPSFSHPALDVLGMDPGESGR
jgi:hypothetical protein